MSTEKRRPAYESARPGEIADRGELAHQLGQPGGVELTDVASVLRQLTRPGVGFLEECVDAGFRLAVDKRLDVPRDIRRGQVCFRDGHGVKTSQRRTADLPAATSERSEQVARQERRKRIGVSPIRLSDEELRARRGQAERFRQRLGVHDHELASRV